MRHAFIARRLIALGLSTLVATSLLVSGAAGAQKTDEQAAVVKLGMITSISGALSAFGTPTARGISMATSLYNQKGGFVVKGKKYKFALKVLDDRSQTQTAVAATTQLVRDEDVKFTIGPLGTLAPQVVQLTQALRVINMNGSSAAQALAGTSDYPLYFNLSPPNRLKAASIAKAIKTFMPNVRRVAIVGPNDVNGQTLGPIFTGYFRNTAKYTTETFLYPAGSSDVSVTMTQVAAFRPDFIVTGWSLANSQTIARSLDAAGIPRTVGIEVFGGGYSASKELVAPLAPRRPIIAHPAIEADFSVPNPTPPAKRFLDRYLKLTRQTTPDANAPSSQLLYNGIPMLVAAMKKAGTVTDTAAIARAMLTARANGILGPIRFNPRATILVGFDLTFIPVTGRVRTIHVNP